MNKDRYQSTSARRALALLNSPPVYKARGLSNINPKMENRAQLVGPVHWNIMS